eukprot:TRINITY_DN1524_c0_g2_i3.p1 TRINITY_DN1524_c0_g2~~TRINITY_DN1524_c0_g2_i3.p1  ORF type:complete len:105 (+),score=2.20 TRINITY_DN1524_c0_g2_i3:1209-1523(+)
MLGKGADKIAEEDDNTIHICNCDSDPASIHKVRQSATITIVPKRRLSVHTCKSTSCIKVLILTLYVPKSRGKKVYHTSPNAWAFQVIEFLGIRPVFLKVVKLKK